MFIRPLITILFFSMLLSPIKGQVLSLDTINQLIIRSKEDTNRVNFLLMKVRDHVSKVPADSVVAICNEAYNLSIKLNFPRGQVNALLIRSRPLIIKGKYNEAEKDLMEAVEMAETHDLQLALGSIWNNIGVIKQNKGKAVDATDAFIKAAQAFEKAGNKPLEAAVLGNLGAIFLNQNQIDKAFLYSQKAYNVHWSLGDTAKATYFLMNMATAQKRKGDTLAAIPIYEKVLFLADKNDRDKELLYGALSNLGEIYYQTNKVERGLSLHQRALTLAQGVKSMDKIALQYKHIANAYLRLGNAREAERYIDLALPLTQKSSENFRLTDIFSVAATVKAATGKKDEALALLRQYNILDDSTTNIDIQKNMNELDTRYQTALKDRAIAEQKADLAQRKIFIISLLAITLFLIGGLFFNRYHYRQRFLRLEKENEIAALKASAEGEEQERSRLARALHDGLGGLLSAAKLNFSMHSTQSSSAQPDDDYRLKGISLLDEAHSETRRIAHSLMPETLEKYGLADALRHFCQNLNGPATPQIDFQEFGLAHLILEKNKALSLYRIVQELVNNALKHAHASAIIVQLNRHDTYLHITVEDDGTGFDPKNKPKKGFDTEGVGLMNLRNRVQLLAGTMTIDTAQGKGTSVHIEVKI